MKTFLAIALIISSLSYVLIYFKRKKNNTHREISYKIIFLITFLMISIPMLML